MPMKFKDLVKICDSVESIINWLIQVGLTLNICASICKSCDFGVLDYGRTVLTAVTATFGDAATINATRKYLLGNPLDLIIII
jgi:hypothetical protein